MHVVLKYINIRNIRQNIINKFPCNYTYTLYIIFNMYVHILRLYYVYLYIYI